MRIKIEVVFFCSLLLGVVWVFFVLTTNPTKNPTESSGQWKTIIEESNLSHTIPLLPIGFVNKDVGIAVRGLSILKTTDSGLNWKIVYDDENIGVYNGIFTDRMAGWVVGTKNFETPLVLRSNDSGITWTSTPFSQSSVAEITSQFTYFRDICFDRNNDAWIIGDGGVVQVENKDNELHLVTFFPTDEGLYRVSCSDSGEVWAVGIKNSVFHYLNGWRRYDLNEEYVFSNVKTFGEDVWLIGKDDSDMGILLRSRDGGKKWEDKSPVSVGELNDLYLERGKGWLVGAGGTIFQTIDSGDSWTKSSSPTKRDLLHIFFLDTSNGWISGDTGIMLKFED